jgi:hypothetical protein
MNDWLNNQHLTVHNPREPEPSWSWRSIPWPWVIGLVISVAYLAYNLLNGGSVGHVVWWAFWSGVNFGSLFATYARRHHE